MWLGFLTARQLQSTHTLHVVAQGSKCKCPSQQGGSHLALQDAAFQVTRDRSFILQVSFVTYLTTLEILFVPLKVQRPQSDATLSPFQTPSQKRCQRVILPVKPTGKKRGQGKAQGT